MHNQDNEMRYYPRQSNAIGTLLKECAALDSMLRRCTEAGNRDIIGQTERLVNEMAAFTTTAFLDALPKGHMREVVLGQLDTHAL